MQRYVIQVRDGVEPFRRIAVVELNFAAVMKAKLLGKWAGFGMNGGVATGVILIPSTRGRYTVVRLRATKHGLIKQIVKQWRVNPSGYAVARGEAEALCAQLNNQTVTVDTRVSDTI